MKPLNPVMAAFLAASSVAFALPGTSNATTPAKKPGSTVVAAPHSAPVKPAPACSAADAEKNPINALTCLISQKPEVRAAIGARLAEFVQGKDASGRQYLTPGLQTDKVNLPGVAAIAQKWPEANKDKPGTVAVLYFVVGPSGDAPAWAQSTVLAKTLKPGMMWGARLADVLALRHWTDTKQIAQSGAADATTAFLDDAAEQAQKVLDDPRTKKDIEVSVGANDTTAPGVPTTAKRPNPLDTTGAGFGFDDLYKTGAVVADVYGPKDEGYRTLSMKVYTMPDGSGHLINKIGIVDITLPDINSPSLTQFIDSSHPGDTDIVMREGGRHYTVTVGSDGSVTLKRVGTKDGEGGSISTSKEELSTKRDEQIMGGGTAMVGGLPYYVLGQGGVKGSYLFFSKAEMDDMKAKMDAGQHPDMNAHPDLMGEVSEVTGEGTTAPIKGEVPLGTLRDGTAWHLAFNMQTRMWNVVAGEAKKKDTPAGAPAGSTGTTTSPAAANSDAGTDPTGAAATLEQAVEIAKADKSDKDQVWIEDAGNGGFDAETLARIRIMSNARSDKMTHFKVLFDPSLGVKGNAFEFQAINKDIRLLHVRGVKNYVALQYATGTQYYDLKNFANYVQNASDSTLAYSMSGSYAVSNGQMQDVTSLDIVEDVLTHYLKVKPSDPMIATIRARVKAHAGDAGFVINGDGSKTSLYLGVGEKGWTIWPNDIAAGDTGTSEKMAGLRGPGTAVEVTGGERGDFKKEMDLGFSRVSTLVKTENHAAVYVSEEDENVGGKVSTVKVWSVMIEYKKNNLDSRSKALTVFGGHDRYALPAGIHMQGLPNLNLPDTTQLMLQYGSNQENGAIAAYRSVLPDAQGGQNVKDKKGNCAGPVLWWGSVTKQQSQAACESDSKIK